MTDHPAGGLAGRKVSAGGGFGRREPESDAVAFTKLSRRTFGQSPHFEFNGNAVLNAGSGERLGGLSSSRCGEKQEPGENHGEWIQSAHAQPFGSCYYARKNIEVQR